MSEWNKIIYVQSILKKGKKYLIFYPIEILVMVDWLMDKSNPIVWEEILQL